MNITFYNLYNRQVMQIKLVNSQELSLFYIGELKITACLSHSAWNTFLLRSSEV
jgi:hypothetical protein